MDTLVQSINSNQSVNILVPSKTPETVNEEKTFSVYLFTNGAEKLFGGLEAAMSDSYNPLILGVPLNQLINKPNTQSPDNKPENDNITEKPESTDAEKFYSDIEKAAPFSFSEEKAKETKFSDIYVPSAAKHYAFSETEKETLTYEEYTAKLQNNLNEIKSDSSAICVPIGAGELPLLMDKILSAISEGGSLKDVLSEQAEKYEQNNNSNKTDLFWINPETGSVVGACKYERTITNTGWKTLFDDDKAVLTAADDLESFIKFAVFALESDDPEKIKEFLNHLKNKQAYADYNRFILDIKSTEDINKIKQLIISNLTAAGILGGGLNEDSDKQDGTEIVPDNGIENDNAENVPDSGIEDDNAETVPDSGIEDDNIGLTPEEELAELLNYVRAM